MPASKELVPHASTESKERRAHVYFFRFSQNGHRQKRDEEEHTVLSNTLRKRSYATRKSIEEPHSRRDFLRNAVALGALATVGGSIYTIYQKANETINTPLPTPDAPPRFGAQPLQEYKEGMLPFELVATGLTLRINQKDLETYSRKIGQKSIHVSIELPDRHDQTKRTSQDLIGITDGFYDPALAALPTVPRRDGGKDFFEDFYPVRNSDLITLNYKEGENTEEKQLKLPNELIDYTSRNKSSKDAMTVLSDERLQKEDKIIVQDLSESFGHFNAGPLYIHKKNWGINIGEPEARRGIGVIISSPLIEQSPWEQWKLCHELTRSIIHNMQDGDPFNHPKTEQGKKFLELTQILENYLKNIPVPTSSSGYYGPVGYYSPGYNGNPITEADVEKYLEALHAYNELRYLREKGISVRDEEIAQHEELMKDPEHFFASVVTTWRVFADQFLKKADEIAPTPAPTLTPTPSFTPTVSLIATSTPVGTATSTPSPTSTPIITPLYPPNEKLKQLSVPVYNLLLTYLTGTDPKHYSPTFVLRDYLIPEMINISSKLDLSG